MIPRRLLRCVLLLAGPALQAAAPAVAPVETVITSDSVDIVQSTDTETTSDFKNHVIVTGTNLRLTCDRLIVVSKKVSDKEATIGDPTGFKSLLAIGHVHMQQNDGLREADCGQAQVFPATDKIVLTRDPVVIDRGNGTRATGDVLEIYKGQREIKGDHIHITMPPIKDLGFDKNQKPPAPPPPAGTPPPKSSE